jgi:hypothetical protein
VAAQPCVPKFCYRWSKDRFVAAKDSFGNDASRGAISSEVKDIPFVVANASAIARAVRNIRFVMKARIADDNRRWQPSTICATSPMVTGEPLR